MENQNEMQSISKDQIAKLKNDAKENSRIIPFKDEKKNPNAKEKRNQKKDAIAKESKNLQNDLESLFFDIPKGGNNGRSGIWNNPNYSSQSSDERKKFRKSKRDLFQKIRYAIIAKDRKEEERKNAIKELRSFQKSFLHPQNLNINSFYEGSDARILKEIESMIKIISHYKMNDLWK
jgi:hypothetical protein